MKNFYNNNRVNPIVENMNNNYVNTFQNFNTRENSSNSFSNKNENQKDTNNKETQNNNQNNDNSKSNVEQTNNLANLLAGLNNPNLKNLLPLLNGGGNYMDLIKNMSGNNINKNELIMNLLTNMNKNNTATIQSKNQQDFSSYKSIEDYDILD